MTYPITDPAPKFVQCITPGGLHRMGYYEWGDPTNPRVLLCVHGLTRCGRDFTRLAQTLATDYRVIAPDMPGRGASDRLANPNEYQVPTYVANIVTLIARLNVESVDWVGTSMGGLIGMSLAALPHTPIRRLVLNDVGPVVAAVALTRIGQYIGRDPHFSDIAAAEAYIRAVAAPFGPHSDADWRFLTEISLRADAAGGYRLHYDPNLAVPFNATAPHQDIALWQFYDAIRCPTLLIRGAHSDLLSADTADAMTRRGPRAERIDFLGVGHAPTLLQAEQIDPVAAFLRRI
jgi:pimeloyl-ACP methyl ester carboxylesterase